MHTPTLRLGTFLFAAGIAILAFSGTAAADPPSRVARLGYMAGPVSFSPAGESDWVEARINRPLTTGDRLWVDAGGRAELQIGGTVLRLNADTGVSILNLDDRIVQMQLTQGSLNVRVRYLETNQVIEVDTPNLAFVARRPGAFRVDVDSDGNGTTLLVRHGQGEVYGDGASYVVDSRGSYRFTGTDLREDRYDSRRGLDEFDRWADDRDRRYDSSISARYVSRGVIGYQDLDEHGAWRVDATYGNVWFPSRVSSDWAPYRDGHWAWIDPWGWTWVDDAPWGFAVSHYGRWTNLRGSWGWVPGPVRSRAYYAPALVAFVGGANFQLTISGGSVGGVAWFPLGPREVYRPSYRVSRGYFENVNRSNTVVTNTVINNYYTNTNVTNVVYANQQVAGAIVAVPMTAFVQSQPVSRSAVRVSREMVASAPVIGLPPIAPTERSVRGAASAGGKPPPRAFERPAVARAAPPAARVGFEAQRSQLAAQPGVPLDEAARKSLKPAQAAPAPVVKVVDEARKAPPTSRPPQAASRAKPEQGERGKSDERKAPAAQAAPPAAAPSKFAPQQAAPSKVAPPQAASRAKPEQGERGKSEERKAPAAQAAPPAAAPSRFAPQQAAPPAQAAPRVETAPAARIEAPAKAAPKARTEQPPRTEPPAKAERPAKAEPPPQSAPRTKESRPPEPQGQPGQRGKSEPQVKPPKSSAEKADEAKKDRDDRKRDEEEGRGKKK